MNYFILENHVLLGSKWFGFSNASRITYVSFCLKIYWGPNETQFDYYGIFEIIIYEITNLRNVTQI